MLDDVLASRLAPVTFDVIHDKGALSMSLKYGYMSLQYKSMSLKYEPASEPLHISVK